MDSLIDAAARALAAGDPLGALDRVALRDDAPALALRGIAMAQLGEFARAKALVRGAARAFGAKESVARARCVVAEAEIALASRDLAWPAKALDAATATLDAHSDRLNAAHARYLAARRSLLIGRLDEAERKLAALDPLLFPPALRAAHELVVAGVALRRLKGRHARAALVRAGSAARQAGIPALVAEVDSASLALRQPAARVIARGEERLVLLDEVEDLLAANQTADQTTERAANQASNHASHGTPGPFVVDACRYAICACGTAVSLASRPVLFTLARALGEAWPDDVPREVLVARAFRAKHQDESHRARLRVEIGRLRAALGTLANVSATKRGFALEPRHGREVIVLAPPVEGEHAALLAFLSDGESWSSSALALVLGASQRTVQRALDSLAAAGTVQPVGQGRARRWMMPPIAGFATVLLLPSPLPND